MKKMALFLVILAGICWGIIGIFSRGLSAAGFSAVQITTIRCVITAVSMLIFLLWKDPDKLKIQGKDIWMFLGTGICSIVFFNICYFKTVQMITLSIAAILLYTAPCFVMLMSAFIFHEKISLQKLLALVLAFTGCVFTTGLLGGGQIQITRQGIEYGLGAGFGYALYSIFGRIALKKYHPFTVTAYTFLVASISLIPFSHIIQSIRNLQEQSISIPAVTMHALLLGLISTLIPFLSYTKGLEYMEAGKASVMAFVEPMVATLVGIMFFREVITLWNLFGISLIFCSVILLNLNFSRTDKQCEVE